MDSRELTPAEVAWLAGQERAAVGVIGGSALFVGALAMAWTMFIVVAFLYFLVWPDGATLGSALLMLFMEIMLLGLTGMLYDTARRSASEAEHVAARRARYISGEFREDRANGQPRYRVGRVEVAFTADSCLDRLQSGSWIGAWVVDLPDAEPVVVAVDGLWSADPKVYRATPVMQATLA